MRAAIIRTLKLPTTYRVIQSATGNLPDGTYAEVAALHSGTGGHETVWARFITGAGWREVKSEEYTATARAIFKL